jgi:hypothetical protein
MLLPCRGGIAIRKAAGFALGDLFERAGEHSKMTRG